MSIYAEIVEGSLFVGCRNSANAKNKRREV